MAKGGIERQLPANAESVLVVPDLTELGQKLLILQRLDLAGFLAQLQGAGSAEQLVSSVMNQIGIDLRSRESMEKAGLAPERGLGIVAREDGSFYSVVAIKDADAFTKTVANLAKTRLGAGITRKEGEATLFARAEKGPPVLAMLVHEGFAWVSQGPDVKRLQVAAALPEAESLAQSKALEAGLGRLPKERDLYALVRAKDTAGSGRGPKKEAPVIPVTLTASLTEKGLFIRSDSPMKHRPELLAALAANDKVTLLGYVPADAFLVARFGGDPSALESVWPMLAGSNVARAVKKSGFDVKAQVLDNLKPGIVLGVSLAPTVPISAGLPRLDVRRTNPFRYLHLAAIAETADAEKAKTTFDALPAVAEGFGAKMTPETRAGSPVLLTTWAQGEGAHLGLVKDRYVMAAPESRLVELIERSKGAGAKTPVAPHLAGAFEQNAFALVLDLGKLAQAIRNLPTAAWGLGGFVIRDTALRWLDAISDLQGIVVAARAKDEAVQTELSLRIAPSREAAPK